VGIGTEVLETVDLTKVEVVLATSVIDETEVVETDVEDGVGTSEGSLGKVYVGLSTSVVHITLSNVDLGVVGKILESNVHDAISTGNVTPGEVNVVLSMLVVHITLGDVNLGVLARGCDGSTMEIVLTVSVVGEKVLEGFEHDCSRVLFF